MWNKSALCLTLSFLPILLFAIDFRLDLVGTDQKIALTPVSSGKNVKIEPARWLKAEQQSQRLCITGAATDEWSEKSFTFTAAQDGLLKLFLLGPDSKSGTSFIAYDDFKLNGKPLENGSFETLRADGTPERWYVSGKDASILQGGAAAGARCVRCNHDNRFFTNIAVKAGEPYTISFQVRLAD